MSTAGAGPCDHGVAHAVASPAEPTAHPAGTLAATILGSSMAFIDGSVVNVGAAGAAAAISTRPPPTRPVGRQRLRCCCSAALILVGGVAGDRYGRRARLRSSASRLFALASVGCGLAPDVGLLIAARAAQGIGGALLVPGSLAIISAVVPRRERGRAIGTWAGFTARSPPRSDRCSAAGWSSASWRWVFLINVPLAAAVLALALRRVPESRDATAAAARPRLGRRGCWPRWRALGSA